MTIQRRILAGHLAVACLLLVPAGYAVVRLNLVARRTHESLQSGLERLKTLEQLRSQFESVVQLQRMPAALDDPRVAPGGPDVRAKTDASMSALRHVYHRARLHFSDLRRLDEMAALDALIERPPSGLPSGEGDATGASVTGTTGVAPSLPGNIQSSAATGAAPPRPGSTPSSAAAAAAPLLPGSTPSSAAAAARQDAARASTARDPGPSRSWSEEEVDTARRGIAAVYEDASLKMLDETSLAEAEAVSAAGLSVLGFAVGIVLAIASTIIVVRGIRKPLRRLMSATMAVTAGKFGIEVPVRGDDEMSRLTSAFNKMSETLANLEKMKADFLSVVSHELKTPLTCIKGFARELRNELQSDTPREKEVARWLERIAQEADLLARKVSELHTFGRIEAGQLRLEPGEIMTEGFLVMLGEAFHPIATERQIDFRVEIDGVPRQFVADHDRLNQVLLNLLDNAFKYTPRGGRVALKGGSRDRMLEIEVSDSGPGIPLDQVGIIFEKYARLRSGPGRGEDGTGLGLAVARGIVVAHGGTIGVTSQPGQGCRFLVRLPLGTQRSPARVEEVA